MDLQLLKVVAEIPYSLRNRVSVSAVNDITPSSPVDPRRSERERVARYLQPLIVTGTGKCEFCERKAIMMFKGWFYHMVHCLL